MNGPLTEDRAIEIVLPSDVYSVVKTFDVQKDLTASRVDGVKVVDLTKTTVSP